MIPDRMHTDGGLVMEQEPIDDYDEPRITTWSELHRLGAAPNVRDFYCRNPRRFAAEMQAVTELGIFFSVFVRQEQGLEVKGWIEMTGCGGAPLYRVVDPVKAARFGWLTKPRRNR